MRLKRGDKAPSFELGDDAGRTVGLRHFKGRNVVLYFYPKGRVEQVLEFRNNFDRIVEKAAILGVSMDDINTHRKYKKIYDIPFILLSDKQGAVSNIYGVLDFY